MRKRLAHVIDRQCRDRGTGQGFHLHAGLVVNLAMTIDDGAMRVVHVYCDFAVIQAQGMTKRYEFMGLFRCHDARDDRRGENRAFRRVNVAVSKLFGNDGWKLDDRPGVRLSVRRVLVADIHHRRLVVLVNVTELGHRQPPIRYISTLLIRACSPVSGLRNSL